MAPAAAMAHHRAAASSAPLARPNAVLPHVGLPRRPMVAAPRQQRAALAVRRAVQDRIATQTIEDLEDPCDDFECTSSPAVEQTVRTLARDLLRLRYSTSYMQPDVTYEDGFRSFKGSGKYARRFWSDAVKTPTVTIVKMRMLDRGTAQLEWRVQGSLGLAGQVDIPVTTTIAMNLLTGRITAHKEQWDLSRLSPPAALLATLQRTSWSLKASAADASEKASKVINESLSSMDGEEGGGYNRDPTDPTRFFQGGQGDSQWQDYVSYATLAAFMYLVFRAYSEVASL